MSLIFVFLFAMSAYGSQTEPTIEKGDAKEITVNVYEDNLSGSITTYSDNENFSSGKDIDALLDDYEDFVDEYIKLMKAAANGDMTAMTKYASVLESAQDVYTDLAEVQSDMTSAQVARYLKIVKKMTDATKSIN